MSARTTFICSMRIFASHCLFTCLKYSLLFWEFRSHRFSTNCCTLFSFSELPKHRNIGFYVSIFNALIVSIHKCQAVMTDYIQLQLMNSRDNKLLYLQNMKKCNVISNNARVYAGSGKLFDFKWQMSDNFIFSTSLFLLQFLSSLDSRSNTNYYVINWILLIYT